MFEARLYRMQRVIDAAVCETRAEQVLNYQATQQGLSAAIRSEMMDKVNRAHELRAAEVQDYLNWLHEDAGPIT